MKTVGFNSRLMKAICPRTEMELNAMVDADARKLDAIGDELRDWCPALRCVAKKAACHLRAMREVRRQLKLDADFGKVQRP